MITSFQTFFEKHYRWMFAFLLVVMVIPFVFAYAPSSSASRGMKSAAMKKFFGHNLADEAQMQEVGRAAAIDEWLKVGYPPQSAEEYQALVFAHIIRTSLVDSLGVPTPTAEELVGYIATLEPFKDKTGLFSQEKFAQFQNRFAKEEGLPRDYLTDRIAECWRLDQLSEKKVALFLPTTLQREYGMMAAEYKTVLAILEPQPNPATTVSAKEVADHFAAHKADYKTPEKRSGTIYSIGADKFLSQVPNPTEEQLQKFFDSIAFRFIQWQMKDEKGNVTGAEPKAPALAEHRDETLKLYKQQKAARAAAEAIDTIVQKFYTEKITPGSKAWNELIKASGVTLTPLTAITKTDATLDSDTLEALFSASLSAQAYSGAFMTETDGRFVLLTAVETSKDQPLAAVEAKVKADALEAKKQAEVAADMKAKVAALKAAYAAEEKKPAASREPFAALAKQAGFITTTPEPFTLTQPALEFQRSSEEILRGLLNAQAGTLVSDLTPRQATVVFVEQKTVPTLNLKDPAVLQLRARIENAYLRLDNLSYLGEWAALHGRG